MELKDQLQSLQGKQVKLTTRTGRCVEGKLLRVDARAAEMEPGGILGLGAIVLIEWMGGRLEAKPRVEREESREEEVAPIPELDVEWVWEQATAAEQEMGRLHYAVVVEAIQTMQREPAWRKGMAEKVRGVRMIAASGGRLALDERWLEVGFGDGCAPPTTREMKELISLIL